MCGILEFFVRGGVLRLNVGKSKHFRDKFCQVKFFCSKKQNGGRQLCSYAKRKKIYILKSGM